MGWLFFTSRVMVASVSVNAVVYEQLGSMSGLLFELPGLRRIPRRFPSVAQYFDLDIEPPAPQPPPDERP